MDILKQKKRPKPSSRSKGAEYQLPSHISGGGFLPATIQTVVEASPSTGEPGHYVISGTLYADGLSEEQALADLKEAHTEQWPDPPHIAFANLQVNRPESVEAFIQRYGVLRLEGRRGLLSSDDTTKVVLPDRDFHIESPEVKTEQLHLQAVWETAVAPDVEGAIPLDVPKVQALEGLEIYDISDGTIQVKATDLLTLIAFLFLRDATARKLGICGNPNCSAPYFRKKRRTQKYCERGPCVQYAQQQYSLDWWNRVGKKRREKKAKTQHKRSKP